MCWYIDYVSLGQLYFYFVLQCHMSLILSFFFYYGGILFFPFVLHFVLSSTFQTFAAVNIGCTHF